MLKKFFCNLYYKIYFFLSKIRREWCNVEAFKSRSEYRDSFRKLKGIHRGKRCFIIGNGPSLTPEDLNMLKDEVTFAANRIFYMFPKTKWRPTYYCAQDMDVIHDIANKLTDIAECCKKMFFISDCRKCLPTIIRDNTKSLFFRAKYVSLHKNRLFSEDISDYISGGGTVTYAAIQIAAYMGFKEIYLIGVDHSYASTSFNNNTICMEDIKGSYFEGMPSGIKMSKPNVDNSTISYVKAREWCENQGIVIKNLTRGGKLEVFNRTTLEEILK